MYMRTCDIDSAMGAPGDYPARTNNSEQTRIYLGSSYACMIGSCEPVCYVREQKKQRPKFFDLPSGHRTDDQREGQNVLLRILNFRIL